MSAEVIEARICDEAQLGRSKDGEMFFAREALEGRVHGAEAWPCRTNLARAPDQPPHSVKALIDLMPLCPSRVEKVPHSENTPKLSPWCLATPKGTSPSRPRALEAAIVTFMITAATRTGVDDAL
jgi:hypothetical protein